MELDTEVRIDIPAILSQYDFLLQYVGDPKNRIFFKKKIYLHFVQKTLNPLQNTLHWRQYTCPNFFPTV